MPELGPKSIDFASAGLIATSGRRAEEQMTSRGRQSLTQIPSTPRPYRAPASRAASALPEHHVASSALSIPPASYKGFRFLAVTREDER